jgi:RND family efflux transporter MFP subunit
MKHIKNTVLISLFSFLILSCGSDHKSKSVADNSKAVNVTVNTISANSNDAFISVSGKIEAANSASISTRMMGYVNKVYVKVGAKVKKGQLLVSINNTDLQAKLAQVNANITKAKAGFKNAEKDYNRFKNLHAENSVSQKELDDVTAHYEMAKAGLEAAKQMRNEVNSQFSYANIRAPFNGVVTGKFIKSGDMANPGVPLVSLESPKLFEVVALVPEHQISQIKQGSKVSVLVKTLQKTMDGTVSEISSSATNTGGQYIVKMTLKKLDVKVLSGMFVTVLFPVDKMTSANEKVLIPIANLTKKGSLKGIYTVSEQGTALLRWLRLGKTYGDKIEVLSGLKQGETYISSSEAKLYNGVKVTIQ